jgi:hypothetical protein
MSRSRGYCFTVNNPTQEDYTQLEELECKYVVYGREVGEEGTKHLQGYAYFHTLKSLRQVKKVLPRAHIESQRGSFSQAISYCKKDGDFVERGSPPIEAKAAGLKGAEKRKRKNLACLDLPL